MSAGNDIVHLANGDLRASILPGAGGTVRSFTVRGKPVLFPVTEPVTAGAWPAGGMPLCFPFAGRVWHQGKPGSYLPTGSDPKAMALHGFTFGKAWRVESKSASGVILSLCDDDATRAVFPWRFTLKLEYELGANALTTTLNIRCDEILPAADGVSMPVAPGFHPYFAARHPVGKQDGYFSFAYDYLEIPALETIAVTPEGNAGPKKLAADSLDGKVQGSHVKVPVHDEVTHNLILSGLSGRVARIGGIEISWTKDSPVAQPCVLGETGPALFLSRAMVRPARRAASRPGYIAPQRRRVLPVRRYDHLPGMKTP